MYIKMENKVRILVTGSEGFIGKHLVSKLKSLKYEVTGMDLKTDGDICTFTDCNRFIRKQDVVIHLAAKTDVQGSISDPVMYNRTNLYGTFNVLYHSMFYEVKRFIFASSAAADKPISPYGVQKRASELYCESFNACYGLSTIALRIFNAYGKGNGKGVIDTWIETIKQGKRPVIYGGNQSRDFVYIDDIVDQIIFQIISTRTGIMEIATGHSINMLDLCDLLLKVIDKPDIVPIIKPGKKGDIERSIGVPCECKYSLEQGLRKMI